MSEEEADEQPIDSAGLAPEQQRVSGGEPAIGQLAGNGVCHAAGEVADILTGGHDEQEQPSDEPETANATTQGVQDQPASVGVTCSSDAKEEWYQPELFNVLEAWILEHLREKLHCGFLLSSHFQEYTRFLYVQNRPVTENDFILFRILGRGGFGAVNGTSGSRPNVMEKGISRSRPNFHALK